MHVLGPQLFTATGVRIVMKEHVTQDKGLVHLCVFNCVQRTMELHGTKDT